MKGSQKNPSLLVKNHKEKSPSSSGCGCIWITYMNCYSHLPMGSSARLQISQLTEDREAEKQKKLDSGDGTEF